MSEQKKILGEIERLPLSRERVFGKDRHGKEAVGIEYHHLVKVIDDQAEALPALIKDRETAAVKRFADKVLLHLNPSEFVDARNPEDVLIDDIGFTNKLERIFEEETGESNQEELK